MPDYGLIGFPLTHSFSKSYFEKKFSSAGLSDHSYELYPIDKISLLPALLSSQPELMGLNVTIPFKTAIIPYLDELDTAAAETGAVNTIVISRNGTEPYLKGYNTDIYGFRNSISDLTGPKIPGALILGTGGASRAVSYVLKNLKVPFHLVSRTAGKNQLAYTDLTGAIMLEHRLVINTTPLGMFPQTGQFPEIPYNLLTPSHYLFDLVYNPPVTAFLIKGKERGCGILNGLKMLHLQADEAFRIWQKHI